MVQFQEHVVVRKDVSKGSKGGRERELHQILYSLSKTLWFIL